MFKAMFLGILCLALTLSSCDTRSSDVPLEANEEVRRIPRWSYEKLVTESDVVAIIEPLENVPAKDTFPGDDGGRANEKLVATDTRFRVHVILKGIGDSAQQLTVLHFAYSENVRGTNAADLIGFLVGPLQYEKRVVKPGPYLGDVELGRVTVFGYAPTWLSFLKRREDGRFEPTTGQFDSRLSFRELHEPSFYTTP